MLNNEEVLNELIKLLGLELKDIKKSRFINREESYKQYLKNIDLIKNRLNIQNTKTNNILMDLFSVYEKIKDDLICYDKKALQIRINWVILKRLVIPYLAYHFAINNINFDIMQYFNPKKSSTPINKIMDWWINQTGNSFSDLCADITVKLQIKDDIESTNPTNTLSEWKFRKELPKLKSIQKYCSLKLNYLNNIKPTNVLSKFMIARVLQSSYQKLLKYFDFNDTTNIEENKLFQLIHLFDYLYNIQKERLKPNNINYDINNLGKVFLTPIENFRRDLPNVRTLYADITIDLIKDFNEDSLQHRLGKCDNIYPIMKVLYQNNNSLNNIVVKEKKDNKYFDDYYEAHFKSNKYLTYSTKEIINKLKDEDNFTCVLNLFKHYKESYQTINIELAEIYCIKLDELVISEKDKMMYLREKIGFHTTISIFTNIDSLSVESLIKDYKLLLKKEDRIENKFKNLLYFDAYFHLKNKDFEKSFECFNEYFNLYILNQKKDNSHYEILNMCAYTSYTLINKGRKEIKKNLKEYNRALNNLNFIKFTTAKDIPFPLYFYK